MALWSKAADMGRAAALRADESGLKMAVPKINEEIPHHICAVKDIAVFGRVVHVTAVLDGLPDRDRHLTISLDDVILGGMHGDNLQVPVRHGLSQHGAERVRGEAVPCKKHRPHESPQNYSRMNRQKAVQTALTGQDKPLSQAPAGGLPFAVNCASFIVQRTVPRRFFLPDPVLLRADLECPLGKEADQRAVELPPYMQPGLQRFPR